MKTLGELFLQVLKLCETAGLVKLGHFALEAATVQQIPGRDAYLDGLLALAGTLHADGGGWALARQDPPLPQTTADSGGNRPGHRSHRYYAPGEATHWTESAMAEMVGISVSSVQRIWRAQGLKPHRVREFKPSNDPAFAAKLKDVVGLYVDPPDHAVVLSIDEKRPTRLTQEAEVGVPGSTSIAKSRQPS